MVEEGGLSSTTNPKSNSQVLQFVTQADPGGSVRSLCFKGHWVLSFKFTLKQLELQSTILIEGAFWRWWE